MDILPYGQFADSPQMVGNSELMIFHFNVKCPVFLIIQYDASQMFCFSTAAKQNILGTSYKALND